MTTASLWGALDSAGFQTMRVLLSLLWQSSIVLLAAGGLVWFLRRRQASVRHLVWVTALVAAPVLPLLAWLGGSVGVPQAKIPVMPAYAVEPVGTLVVPAVEQVLAVEPMSAVEPVPAVKVPPLPAAPPPPPLKPQLTLTDYPWALAVMAYGAGVGLFLFLVLLGRYRISRWLAGGSVVTDERVLGAFGEAGRQLGLNRHPLIVATAWVQAPVTIGAFRPAVLFPEEVEAGLSAGDLRAIALHECAHIRRRDPLVLSLASLLRALLFFHPLVWLACRRISLLTEQAADDVVLDVTGEPVAYAKMLARLAEELRRRSLTTELAAGIVLSKSAFLRRVEAILSDRSDSLRRLSRRALALTILAALLSLALAAAVPLSEKESAATKQQSGARAGGGISRRMAQWVQKREETEEFFAGVAAFDKEGNRKWDLDEAAVKKMSSRDLCAHFLKTPSTSFLSMSDDPNVGIERLRRSLNVMRELMDREDTVEAILQCYGESLLDASSPLFRPGRQNSLIAHHCITLVQFPPAFEKTRGKELRVLAVFAGFDARIRALMEAEGAGSPLGLDDRMRGARLVEMLWEQHDPKVYGEWWDQHGLTPRSSRSDEALSAYLDSLYGEIAKLLPEGAIVVPPAATGQLAPPTASDRSVIAPLTAAEQALRDKLAKHVTFSFADAPLEAVVYFLHGAADINVVVDQRVLDAAGPGGKRVTLTLTNVPLHDALDMVLPMLDLEWTVRDGSVHISPKKPEPRAAPAVGQVVERVVHDDDPGSPCLLDLDTGELLVAPVEATGDAQLEFMRRHGVDAVGETNIPGLGCIDMRLLYLGGKDEVWQLDPQSYLPRLAQLQPARHDGSRGDEVKSRGIYAFETREGSRGILQVLGVDGESIRLRYKLVALAGRPLTGVSAGTAATAGSGAALPLGEKVTASARNANAAPGGGVLRYRHGLLPVLQQEVGYLGGQELKRAEQKPELKAEPAYAGEPVYFLIDLGERGSPPHVAVYDPRGGGGEGAVYFDLDQDGDLAEEEPLPPAGWGSTDNFGPIAVKLKRDGFVGLYHFWMERRPSVRPTTPSGGPSPSPVAPSPPESWMLRPGCYNVGEITFAGKTYKAAMVDAWTNGRFDDICWSRLGQGDVLLVDWNGNGTFDWPELLGVDAHEYIMVGERYWREGTWYRPQFSTDGTEVSFTPTDFELAPLLTGHEKFWMQVTSRSNTGSVQIEGTGGRVDLPVDEYSLYLCGVEAKDTEGRTWRAEATTGGPYPSFEVKAGEENRSAFGPPFSVSLKASPEGSYQSGQAILFQPTITGAEGKTYVFARNGGPLAGPRMFLATGDDGRMLALRVVLKDESGKEISSLQMQYGYPGGSVQWTVPDNVKGAVTATPSIETGPFAWKADDLVLEVR